MLFSRRVNKSADEHAFFSFPLLAYGDGERDVPLFRCSAVPLLHFASLFYFFYVGIIKNSSLYLYSIRFQSVLILCSASARAPPPLK